MNNQKYWIVAMLSDCRDSRMDKQIDNCYFWVFLCQNQGWTTDRNSNHITKFTKQEAIQKAFEKQSERIAVEVKPRPASWLKTHQ